MARTTKQFRIIFCSVGTLLSVAIMMVPFLLTYLLGTPYVVFSFIAWVGLFFAGTFLAILVSQFVRIEATANPTANFFGIEMPVEIKGITVVLLGFYVLLSFFYLATDLEGQLSARALQDKIEDKQDTIDALQNVIAAFKSVHEGNHGREVRMLRLSYHCGANERKDKVIEWNRYNVANDKVDEGGKSSSDGAFPVSQDENVYRIRYRSDEDGANWDDSPLKVYVRLDDQGILTAEIKMIEPSGYEELWYHCKQRESAGGQQVSSKANLVGGGAIRP